MQDMLAGNVDCVVIDCATGIPFIRDGRVRALLVMSEGRSTSAPDVPTVRQLGTDAVAYGWQGLAVAAATPAPILARMNAELNRAIASEEMQARFGALGIESAAMSPAEFAEFTRRDNAVWRPLIRELGIRLDS
jgi:tripartite-type tricarboxylate transporter receptor subunit TctC